MVGTSPQLSSGFAQRMRRSSSTLPVTSMSYLQCCQLSQQRLQVVRQPVNGFIGITGRICDWKVATRLVAQSTIPVILGGGISPENAAAGIKQVRPAGVDSCTETNARDSNGRPLRFKKDVEKIKQLVAEVRRVEQEIKPQNKSRI